MGHRSSTLRSSFAHRPPGKQKVHPPPSDRVVDHESPDALRYLVGGSGPDRFSQVADGIYRGGQPDPSSLERLRELGVDTVVSLRRERRHISRRERSYALELGMRFLHFPFYGVFGADDLFVMNIVEEVKRRNVYVHCKHGRDRTSLIIALYRVMEERWDPEEAWQREAIAYGSAQTYFYRQLRVVYERVVEKYRH